MDPLRPDEQLRQTPRFWEKVEVTKQYLKYIYICVMRHYNVRK